MSHMIRKKWEYFTGDPGMLNHENS